MLSPNDMQAHDISLHATLQSSSIKNKNISEFAFQKPSRHKSAVETASERSPINSQQLSLFFCATSAVSVTLARRVQRRHHDAATVSGMSIHPAQDEANRKTKTLERDAKTNRLWIETSCCSEGEAVQV